MSRAAAPRQATGMTGDALAASNAWNPAASRQDALVSERSGLLDLAAGRAIVIPGADLVQLANLRYEGPDPDADPDSISAARYALDMYWYRAGEARPIGGERARGMHYVLCCYLLPFLLEHRGEGGPLQAARLRISDVTTLVQVLAGERPMPAATVAADRVKRLAVTCHWLTLDDAAIACAIDREEVAVHVAHGTHALSPGQGDRRAGSSHRRNRPRQALGHCGHRPEALPVLRAHGRVLAARRLRTTSRLPGASSPRSWKRSSQGRAQRLDAKGVRSGRSPAPGGRRLWGAVRDIPSERTRRKGCVDRKGSRLVTLLRGWSRNGVQCSDAARREASDLLMVRIIVR